MNLLQKLAKLEQAITDLGPDIDVDVKIFGINHFPAGYKDATTDGLHTLGFRCYDKVLQLESDVIQRKKVSLFIQ